MRLVMEKLPIVCGTLSNPRGHPRTLAFNSHPPTTSKYKGTKLSPLTPDGPQQLSGNKLNGE